VGQFSFSKPHPCINTDVSGHCNGQHNKQKTDNMGIFDSTKKNTNTKTTKGFYFGAPEAEAENVKEHNLTDYFEDFLDILDNLKMGKFIFIGRKGVGKSAISKFIKDKSDKSDNSFASILRLSDFETEKKIQINSNEVSNDTLLFEWLILINVVKLVVKNKCGIYTGEFTKLQKFIDNNSGTVHVDKFQIEEGFEKSGGEINFGVLTHSFGGVFKKYFDVKVTKAPYYKLIPPLKEIVKIILDYDINKETEFWLLFDDLDINFNIYSENDKKRVMELIRLAKNYNNEIFAQNKATILIFLRDDVREKLISEYTDSAKIFNSYEIIINWYNQAKDENKIALKRLVNKRIELNFKNKNIEYDTSDPWNSLFSDNISQKSSFKYILDFSFYRPRDIITILNITSEQGVLYPISQYDLKIILQKYIERNINEIKSELSLLFNEQEKNKLFTSLFRYISDYPIKSYQQIIDYIKTLGFSMQPEIVIDILISYSFLIPSNSTGELFFNYRESIELNKIKKEELNINLPKCIYHYYRQIS